MRSWQVIVCALHDVYYLCTLALARIASLSIPLMHSRNKLALGLTLISLACLYPGLTQPVLTITASIEILGNTREIFRETQSITQSVRSLFESGNSFVASMILLFSILIPLIKALLVAVILFQKPGNARTRLYDFVRSISKWSMADVFVVGVFLAFLAARALDALDAQAGAGLYYFAAYCLLSNLAFQVLTPAATESTAPPVS